MVRAFVAIEIDSAVMQRVIAATDELRPALSGIRWTPQANCHLTLKFLGNMEEQHIERAGQALERELAPFPRFSINAKGLGVFPDATRPRVLWVGFDGKPLTALTKTVEKALGFLGFERDKRKFTPHLTIGRWRQFTGTDIYLKSVLKEWQNRAFGVSSVHEVILFQSILNPDGVVYRRLKTARLSA